MQRERGPTNHRCVNIRECSSLCIRTNMWSITCTQDHALDKQYVWSMAVTRTRDEWRCAVMECGGQCTEEMGGTYSYFTGETGGTHLTGESSADSWDFKIQVQLTYPFTDACVIHGMVD